jgi:hypothetical protein
MTIGTTAPKENAASLGAQVARYITGSSAQRQLVGWALSQMPPGLLDRSIPSATSQITWWLCLPL